MKMEWKDNSIIINLNGYETLGFGITIGLAIATIIINGIPKF